MIDEKKHLKEILTKIARIGSCSVNYLELRFEFVHLKSWLEILVEKEIVKMVREEMRMCNVYFKGSSWPPALDKLVEEECGKLTHCEQGLLPDLKL